MRKPHRFLSARERHQFEQLWQLKMAATDLHNVDAFFKRAASLDLLEIAVFPRSSVVKEISECEALRETIRRDVKCLNVGVDVHDFRPISEARVIELIEASHPFSGTDD